MGAVPGTSLQPKLGYWPMPSLAMLNFWSPDQTETLPERESHDEILGNSTDSARSRGAHHLRHLGRDSLSPGASRSRRFLARLVGFIFFPVMLVFAPFYAAAVYGYRDP
jgi:hypothetical protein